MEIFFSIWFGIGFLNLWIIHHSFLRSNPSDPYGDIDNLIFFILALIVGGPIVLVWLISTSISEKEKPAFWYTNYKYGMLGRYIFNPIDRYIISPIRYFFKYTLGFSRIMNKYDNREDW